MAYFQWHDDLVIDNGPIDADHIKLVDLVNQLHSATSEGRGMEVVGDLLKQLIDDTEEHLRHEEACMVELQFPNIEQHKIGHQHFVKELRRLQERFDAGSITVAAQLSTVLRDWLSLHIRRNDRELLEYMRKRKRGA